MAIPHITYNGASKVIRRLCEIVNGIIDAATDVTVTPQLKQGTPVAKIAVDGAEYQIYAPDGTDVTVTPQLNQGTPVAKIAVDGAEYQIYAPNVNFHEYNAHPLDDIAVNPDWAYWDNGYAESRNSHLWAHTPLFPPLLFTDREGYVCAAYDGGNGNNGGGGGGGDIK